MDLQVLSALFWHDFSSVSNLAATAVTVGPLSMDINYFGSDLKLLAPD